MDCTAGEEGEAVGVLVEGQFGVAGFGGVEGGAGGGGGVDDEQLVGGGGGEGGAIAAESVFVDTFPGGVGGAIEETEGEAFFGGVFEVGEDGGAGFADGE